MMLPLAVIPTGAYARIVEPRWLELTQDEIGVPGLHGGERIRLVQLSDLHASSVVPNSLIEKAVQMAITANPDVICLTGDYITEGDGYDRAWYVRTLRRLAAHRPCFATLGNHDGDAWSGRKDVRPYSTDAVVSLLQDSYITVLKNERVEVAARSAKLRLVGMGDLWAHHCNPWDAFRGVTKDSMATVILSHNPDSKVMMKEFRWDLMLSGHTHGGQVVMPVTGANPAPVNDKRYVKGLKPWNGRMIHVSAGIGNVGGVRFNCRPQVNILDLRSA